MLAVAGHSGPRRERVWAVAVAYERDDPLDHLLTRLSSQTLPLAGVIVVDNANLPSTAAVAARHGADYLGSHTNLGGAGGFSLGILTALSRGANRVWLWDDDGYPEDDHCLAILVRAMDTRGADLVAPLVVSDTDAEQTAFVFRLGGARTTERRVVQRHAQIDNFAHLFNGALISADGLERFGLPDYRLFIRGDEVDLLYRIVGGGGVVFTHTAAVARHPSGAADISQVPGLPLGVLWPANPARRAITFRNRAFIFRRHGKFLLLIADYLRYGAFFLLRSRPDWRGWRDWLAATWQGYAGIVGRSGGGAPAPLTRPQQETPIV